MVQFDEREGEAKLAQLRAQEEEDLSRILAEKHGLDHIDLTATPLNTDALKLISETDAREAELVAFNRMQKHVDVGVRSPANPKTVAALDKLRERGYEPKLHMVSGKSLHYAWERYKDLSFAEQSARGSIDISSADIKEFIAQVKQPKDAERFIFELLKGAHGGRISRVIEAFVAAALATHASDIHIEPEEHRARLRLRLDGILTDFATFDTRTYQLLMSRLKIVSGLKVNVKDTAQDGRFSIELDNKEIEVRTSIIPSEHGESAVLRILNPDTTIIELEKLGIDAELEAVLNREIRQPNGMILTTGPTGSGKTTMLYAILRKVYSPDVKIITIEDPIEYHLEGIVQTQAGSKKNYTFASGLRSILRQDPDVIMVGEIRDKETAETAVNAALTGHLVLSTLHTNNAAGTFPRLLDLGVSPKVVGAAVRLAMAQRLVRVLCDACKERVALTGDAKVYIEKVIDSLPPRRREGLEVESVWEPRGCEKCNTTGYRGRIGIYEAIRMTDAVEKIVREGPTEDSIWEAAKDQELLTMRQDGVLKILAGTTSFDELIRVVGSE